MGYVRVTDAHRRRVIDSNTAAILPRSGAQPILGSWLSRRTAERGLTLTKSFIPSIPAYPERTA